jgi:hypothetical protein
MPHGVDDPCLLEEAASSGRFFLLPLTRSAPAEVGLTSWGVLQKQNADEIADDGLGLQPPAPLSQLVKPLGSVPSLFSVYHIIRGWTPSYSCGVVETKS